MGERTQYAPGTFSWADLSTSDQEAANGFYGTLFGWELEDVPIGDDAVYTMARLEGRDVAAIGPLQDPSQPPHWNCYVTVADTDAAVARVGELGATVLAEPFDVFDSGRMAVFQDPQGAILSVWQAGQSIGAELVNVPGALSWNDLLTPDVDASAAFYRELFGWQVAETEGSGGQYFSIENAGRLNGGMMPAQPGMPPVWNAYFAVADLDTALQAVEDGGGASAMEPMEVPAGRFALVRDPQGAHFSLFTGQLDD